MEPGETFTVASETGDTDCVIKLQGDIDLRAVPRLRGALSYAIDGRPARVIIDLTDVAILDITGFAVIVAAGRRARDIGTPVFLRAPNAATRDVLTTSGLDKVLGIVGVIRTGQDGGSDRKVRRRHAPW